MSRESSVTDLQGLLERIVQHQANSAEDFDEHVRACVERWASSFYGPAMPPTDENSELYLQADVALDGIEIWVRSLAYTILLREYLDPSDALPAWDRVEAAIVAFRRAQIGGMP